MNHQQWTLKDKSGNPPSPDDYKKYMKSLQKLDRNLLFPCSRSADDLEMPKKNSEAAPREMNSFIIFRRQLAYIFKQRKLSDDGKVLSRAASYIWNGASQSDRQSYVQIAEELKRRHLIRYPDYTYERRKRKTAEEDFVIIDTESFKETNKKKRKVQTRAEPNLVHEESVPASTSPAQEQENEWLCNNSITSLTSDSWSNYDNTLIPPQIQQSYQTYDDNECYTYDSRDCYPIGDVDIPQVTNSILSQNYTDVSTFQQLQQQFQQQQLQQFQQQQQLQQLQQHLPQHLPQIQSPSTYYFSDYIIDGGDPGIRQPFDGLFALERPIDDILFKF